MEPSTLGGVQDTRRRKLDELFADQPYLSATMRAYQAPHGQGEATGGPFTAPKTLVQPADAIAEARLRRLESQYLLPCSVPAETGRNPLTTMGVVRPLESSSAVELGRPTVHRRERVRFDDVLTSWEAAQYLKIGTQRVRTLAREAQIPAARVGSRWRFRREALLEWLKSLEQ